MFALYELVTMQLFIFFCFMQLQCNSMQQVGFHFIWCIFFYCMTQHQSFRFTTCCLYFSINVNFYVYVFVLYTTQSFFLSTWSASFITQSQCCAQSFSFTAQSVCVSRLRAHLPTAGHAQTVTLCRHLFHRSALRVPTLAISLVCISAVNFQYFILHSTFYCGMML